MKHTHVTCDICGEPARYAFSLFRLDGLYNIYDGGYGEKQDLCEPHADLVINVLELKSDIRRSRTGLTNG